MSPFKIITAYFAGAWFVPWSLLFVVPHKRSLTQTLSALVSSAPCRYPSLLLVLNNVSSLALLDLSVVTDATINRSFAVSCRFVVAWLSSLPWSVVPLASSALFVAILVDVKLIDPFQTQTHAFGTHWMSFISVAHLQSFPFSAMIASCVLHHFFSFLIFIPCSCQVILL